MASARSCLGCDKPFAPEYRWPAFDQRCEPCWSARTGQEHPDATARRWAAENAAKADETAATIARTLAARPMSQPRAPVEAYKKTVIYKISARDPSIKHVFFGATINMRSKRNMHHIAADDPFPKNRLHKFIREHGGWRAWSMEVVEPFPCASEAAGKMRAAVLAAQLPGDLNLARD